MKLGVALWFVLGLALCGCASNHDMWVKVCDQAWTDEEGVENCTNALKLKDLSSHEQAQVLSDRGYYLVRLGPV